MKINTFEIDKTNEEQLETEILFYIASSRAEGKELVKLSVKGERKERTISIALKILRAAKKRNTVQLFLTAQQMYGRTTEGEYIKNKYPDVQNILDNGESAVLIKV